MGAYLSEPDKETHSVDDKSTRFRYGASSMQGWRISNEDAHSCILDFDRGSALFAVYDGHGGAEVAIYTAEELPKYIKNHELYKGGQIEKALEECFIEFDQTLRQPDVAAKLTAIADKQAAGSDREDEQEQPGPSGSAGGSSSGTSKVNGKSSIVEDVDASVLKQEAELPIEEIIRKYCAEKNSSKMIPLFKNLIAKRLDCLKGIPNSPMVKSANSQKAAAESSSNQDSKDCHISGVDGDTTTTSTTTNTTTQVNNTVETNEDSSNQTANDHQDSSATPKSIKVSSDEPAGSSPSKNTETSTDEEMAQNEQNKSEDGPSSSQGTSSDHEGARLAFSLLMSGDVDEDSSDGSDFDSEDLDSSNDDDDDEDDDDGDDEDDDDIDLSAEVVRHRLRKFKRKFKNEIKDSDDDEQDEDAEEEEDDNEEVWEDEEETSGDDERSKSYPIPGKDSGCTAVVALFRENTLYVANAGDSRCVVCREGKALEMSFDHKPEDKIESDRIHNAGGRITEDGRVNGGLNLSRAIGDYSYKNNKELSNREQMITALPDVKKCEIDPKTDAFVVLACDGIWNSMSSQEVVDFVKVRIDKAEKLSSICEELFHHCLAKDTSGDGTGCDNMTCIIIGIDENTLHKGDDLESDKHAISGEANIKRKCDEDSELPKKKECV